MVPDFVEVLPDQGSIRGLQAGDGTISLTGNALPFDATTNIRVLEAEESIMKLDPIVASLRMSLASEPSENRLGTTDVSFQILSRLVFAQERAEVTASVLLGDGRRVVIADPSLLQIQSSNESVVRVENNFIVANETGNVYLNVSFVVCDRQLATSIISVTVQFDDYRPEFVMDMIEASIIENSAIGSFVTTVQATDADFPDGQGKDTEYRLKDDLYGGLWIVDTITGVITLNGPIDRETRDRYELTIEATDRLQRQAEVVIPVVPVCPPGAGSDGSGSGVGSGDCDGEMLTPDNGQTQGPIDTIPPPATANVSNCY